MESASLSTICSNNVKYALASSGFCTLGYILRYLIVSNLLLLYYSKSYMNLLSYSAVPFIGPQPLFGGSLYYLELYFMRDFRWKPFLSVCVGDEEAGVNLHVCQLSILNVEYANVYYDDYDNQITKLSVFIRYWVPGGGGAA